MNPSFTNRLLFVTSTKVLLGVALFTVTLGVLGDGPLFLTLFYIVLAVWSLLLSYRLVIINTANVVRSVVDEGVSELESVGSEEQSLSVPIVSPQMVTNHQFGSDVPPNLPVVGYSSIVPTDSVTKESEVPPPVSRDDLVYGLEEQAHAARVLLSSDALRHFLATVPKDNDPRTVMASVITLGKQRFPSEDGWVVINEERMSEVCVSCLASAFPVASNEAPYVPMVVPEGTGSLAEMVATTNVGAAFALIGHRPMFALSDAVADFDALYRKRRGESTHVSTLLTESTKDISDDTLRKIMTALTSALDGVYTNEAEAVKTAIMKAVKVRG